MSDYRKTLNMPDTPFPMRGDLAKPPFRGMSYNTSIAELIAILNIGSISIKIQ